MLDSQPHPPQAKIRVFRQRFDRELAAEGQRHLGFPRLDQLHVGRQIADHFDPVPDRLLVLAALDVGKTELI